MTKTTTKTRKRAKDARKSTRAGAGPSNLSASPGAVPGDLSPARQKEQDAEHEAAHIRNSILYGRMESDIYNLAGMASATRLMLDDYFDEVRGFATLPNVTAKELIARSEPWSDAVDCMVTQLEQMAKALRSFYTDGDAKAAA